MPKYVKYWIDSWSGLSEYEANSADSTERISQDKPHINWIRIIPFIILHLACFGVFFVGFSWFALGFMVFFYLLRMFAITAFFHRYLSHKAFETSRVVQFIFTLIGTMSGQRGPLWWVAHHRFHHRYTDTNADPHSSKHGFLYSHLLWFLDQRNFYIRKNAVKDWLKFPELVWIDRCSFLIVIATALAIYFLGEWLAVIKPELGTNGLQLLVWGFVLSTVLLIHATLCINSVGHMYGSRDFKTDDDSRNNFWLSLVTLGEGWHNNHHYYAGSARQGFYWWQIDIVYMVLKLMSWCGIVWNLKPVPQRVYEARFENKSTPNNSQNNF